MTQAKLSSGDLNGYGGFLGGNDGTMVVEVGVAGAKVNALSADAAGQVTLPANTANKLVAASGAAPVFGCRAWVSFNGTTGAILASGNVSSVTRNSAGDYTINFATAMPDANYAVSISAGNSTGPAFKWGDINDVGTARTASLVRISVVNSSVINADDAFVTVMIVR